MVQTVDKLSLKETNICHKYLSKQLSGFITWPEGFLKNVCVGRVGEK